jgi:hypothetical protein
MQVSNNEVSAEKYPPVIKMGKKVIDWHSMARGNYRFIALAYQDRQAFSPNLF